MPQSFTLHLRDVREADRDRVGGKAYPLARLLQAGLPVPEGFCITAQAFEHSPEGSLTLRPDARQPILHGMARLDSPALAVRSSASAEDLAETSFAGQYRTFLNVRGEADLLEAVLQCARSISSASTSAYRARAAKSASALRSDPVPPETLLLAAVLVQSMLEPEVAGVLFTANPVTGDRGERVIEAVQGLGDQLVGGKTTPERLVLGRDGLTVLCHSPGEGSSTTILQPAEALELCRLAERVESLLGRPLDMEWARAGGRWFVLQARPITALSPPSDPPRSRAGPREAEIHRLQQLADPRGTVWSSYNLSETLPAPTPMTWSILRPFLSGGGGLGRAYRRLGFRPGPRVDREGILDLVCGRPYYNLSREPQMYFSGFPLEHSFEALKARPERAAYPEPKINLSRADAFFFIRFPYYVWVMTAAELRLRFALASFDQGLRQEVLPRFEAWARGERQADLDRLSDAELRARLHRHIEKTLPDLGCEVIQGSLLAGKAVASLQETLRARCGNALALLPGLLRSAEDDLSLRIQRELREVGAGSLALETFLEHFGHRAPGELDFAQPRWRETPAEVLRLARLAHECPTPGPAGVQAGPEACRCQFFDAVPSKYRRKVARQFDLVQRYLPFRESGKSALMLAFELIRIDLLEIGRRSGLGPDVFFLELSEMDDLSDRRALQASARRRREERDAFLEIEVPPVLFSDDLEAIGRPTQAAPSHALQGVGVSPGVAMGPALVAIRPDEAASALPGFILVCVSADPGWTPLFARARGLVAERGGLLSHSAIVAREFGIPAVVNLPAATRLIPTGRIVRVDGRAGNVTLQ
ncbi:MAG: hypothetical protein HYU36_13960 [Planctomycetes bacterium]|nr:hypothetical protein [Planctomycetota bacterium]